MKTTITANYNLLKRTGLKEDSTIGNSKRTVVVRENKKKDVKGSRSHRVIKKSGQCSGCSRNKRK